jgi:ribosomal protein S6--L-glutamate ligase
MILSFHPVFRGDANLLCAGRDPGPADLAAIRKARAVVLPQGCPRRLYEMARANCRHVFPGYDARFRYPGKTGQIRLFRETGTSHPPSAAYASTSEYVRRTGARTPSGFPLVFKFDWGGEGETVFLLRSPDELAQRIERAARYEAAGQKGFVIQQYVPCGGRSLRVAVVGARMVSYWRVLAQEGGFHASVSRGARLDFASDPDLRRKAEAAVGGLCRRTGINLAGIDVIFAQGDPDARPLVLEVNYFFGRSGLGGSEAFYRMLGQEIRRWLKSIDA